MNKVIKVLGIILIIFFLSLYFSKYNSNYYENKTVLTNSKILEYEKDLKSGKKINSNDYVVKEKNYSNSASRIGMKISKLIEKGFDSGLKFLIKGLESVDK